MDLQKSFSKILLNIFNNVCLVEFCLWFFVYLFVYLGIYGADKYYDIELVNLKELEKFYEEIVLGLC